MVAATLCEVRRTMFTHRVAQLGSRVGHDTIVGKTRAAMRQLWQVRPKRRRQPRPFSAAAERIWLYEAFDMGI